MRVERHALDVTVIGRDANDIEDKIKAAGKAYFGHDVFNVSIYRVEPQSSMPTTYLAEATIEVLKDE